MLRDTYPGYQSLNEDDFRTAWREGRVVLDTNVLLGLYRYDVKTRTELLSALKRVSDRLWMPYQVGLEYNRRRLTVIAGEKRAFDKAAESVRDHSSKIAGVFSDKSRNPHPSKALGERLSKLAELTNEIVVEVQKLGNSLPDVHEHDVVREAISDLFGDRIGAPPTKEWLEQAEKDAKQRFEAGIPPGFEDDKKNETYTDRGLSYDSQYGDVLIWLQILQEAKKSGWPALILVTDDAKSDWWYVAAGKTIGPRAELREEIQRVAAVPIFQSYSTAQFLENANRQLDAKVSESSIALVREVAKPQSFTTLNSERLQRLAQNAVRRWLASTTSKTTRIIPSASLFDYVVDRDGAKSGIIIKFVPGPPNGEMTPHTLNSIARTLSDDVSETGVDFVEAFLVFSDRISLDRHFDTLASVVQRLRSVQPLLHPKVGTLMRTNDGNYTFVPFDLGVFG